MSFEIILAPEAIKDWKQLQANDRAMLKEALEIHLRYEPTKISKTRIKRLRGISKPQYRLRVDDFRVFFDVNDKTVEILTIVEKQHAGVWLEQFEILEGDVSDETSSLE